MQTITRTYRFIYDASHGWLEVPAKDLIEWPQCQTVSYYSYRNGTIFYLEEDWDAPRFINWLKTQNIEVEMNEVYHGGDSVVRRYKPVTEGAINGA